MAWRLNTKVYPAGAGITLAFCLTGLSSAQALPSGDPIGDLLQAPPPAPEAASPPATLPAAPIAPITTPAEPPPAPWAPPARPHAPAIAPTPARPDAARGEPVYINQTDRTPDGPPTASDRNYEARLRASFASAQGMQGPLDGSWILATASGADLFALQLVDKSGKPLEGAWRDVRRIGAFEGSGFVSQIERSGATLIVRFQPKPGEAEVTARLTAADGGRWTGEMEKAGRRTPVEMRRD